MNFNSNKRVRTSSPELSVSPDRLHIDTNISLTSAPKFQSPDRPPPSEPCSISPSARNRRFITSTVWSIREQRGNNYATEDTSWQTRVTSLSGQPSTPIAIQPAEAPSPTQSISQNSPPRATKLRDNTDSRTKTADEVNFLSQCSCLKHILALLDGFEVNFEQTHIICMLCFDPSRPLYGQFDITDVEYEKLSLENLSRDII